MTEPYEDLGAHSRYEPQPDGLDVKCPVCRSGPGVFCVSGVTGLPRRGNVSCIGRKVRG